MTSNAYDVLLPIRVFRFQFGSVPAVVLFDIRTAFFEHFLGVDSWGELEPLLG